VATLLVNSTKRYFVLFTPLRSPIDLLSPPTGFSHRESPLLKSAPGRVLIPRLKEIWVERGRGEVAPQLFKVNPSELVADPSVGVSFFPTLVVCAVFCTAEKEHSGVISDRRSGAPPASAGPCLPLSRQVSVIICAPKARLETAVFLFRNRSAARLLPSPSLNSLIPRSRLKVNKGTGRIHSFCRPISHHDLFRYKSLGAHSVFLPLTGFTRLRFGLPSTRLFGPSR